MPGALYPALSARLVQLAVPALRTGTVYAYQACAGDMTATGMRPLLEQMVKAALLVNILFSAGLICQRL